MDNNPAQPTSPAQSQPQLQAAPAAPTPPVQPPGQPPAQPAPAQAGTPLSAKSSGNKKFLLLIIGLVLAVLIIGVIFFIFSSQKTKQPADRELKQTSTSTVKPEDNLDKELDSIDIQTPDSDFTSLDQDLQGL